MRSSFCLELLEPIALALYHIHCQVVESKGLEDAQDNIFGSLEPAGFVAAHLYDLQATANTFMIRILSDRIAKLIE
jgi:hypothetical protein